MGEETNLIKHKYHIYKASHSLRDLTLNPTTNPKSL